MKRQPLPACPAPYRDELMSSWLERIGLFYGVGYHGAATALLPGRDPSMWASERDLDADAETRSALLEWTLRKPKDIPAALNPSGDNALPRSARLAYCPACWEADIAAGRQPYVRLRWVRWSVVHCTQHETWLAGRQPKLWRQSQLEGWIDVWRSRSNWAHAFGYRDDPQLEISATAFLPSSFDQPACGWSTFDEDLRAALGPDRDENASPFAVGSIVAATASEEFSALRRKVRMAMQLQPPHVRVDDLDLKSYSRTEPVWIPNRIACMAIAVEFVRMFDDRTSMFPLIRPLLDSAECVWTLRSRNAAWAPIP